MGAAERWAAELAAWAIDPAILAAAPESPYGFPPELFAAGPHLHASPLHDLARAALPPGGTVLDVGVGGGAAGLPVVPPDGHLHAVDSQPSMLAAIAAAAAERGVAVTAYEGRWPDIAATVPVCDVVVVGHVFYNVPDLVPFVTALTEHARERVVVEVTERHPMVRLAPMWQELHGQPRPDGPTAELALEVLREAGLDPQVHVYVRPHEQRTGAVAEAWVDFTRRQLCVGPDRRAEVVALMQRFPPVPRRLVVFAWPGAAA